MLENFTNFQNDIFIGRNEILRFALDDKIRYYFPCSFGLRSKNGFFDEALTGMANTCLHPFNIPRR